MKIENIRTPCLPIPRVCMRNFKDIVASYMG
jgi:hypothetical protein